MAEPSPSSPGLLNWFLLNLLGVVWGTSFLSIGISLETIPPMTVAASRILIAAVAITAILPVFGASLGDLRKAEASRFAVYSGLIGFTLPFVLLAFGQQFVPSAVAGVAMGSVPLLLVPLVFIFSPEEGIGVRRIGGLVLGFLGLLFIVAPGLSGASGENFTIGALACIGAAFAYAVASVITRRSPAVHPMVFAAASMIVAAAAAVPIALLLEGIPEGVSLRSGLAMLWLGLFPTAMAGALRVRIIKTAGSLFMSIASYLVPLWSVIFGIVLMGEDVTPSLYIALVLILGGIALAQSRQIGAIFRRA